MTASTFSLTTLVSLLARKLDFILYSFNLLVQRYCTCILPLRYSLKTCTVILLFQDEDSENANPKVKSGRKFLNKLPFPEAIVKSRAGKIKIDLRISLVR